MALVQAVRLALGALEALVAVVAVVRGVDGAGGHRGTTGAAAGGRAVEHGGAHGTRADLAREAEPVAHGRCGRRRGVVVVVRGAPARDGGLLVLGLLRAGCDAALRLGGIRLLVDVGRGGRGARIPEDVVGEGVVVRVLVREQQRVQQVRGGCVGRDQVGGVLGLAHVQDLEAAVPGAGREGTGVLHHGGLVRGRGNQDGHPTAQDLVLALEHVVVVGGAQQRRADLVAAAQDGSERDGLGHGGSL